MSTTKPKLTYTERVLWTPQRPALGDDADDLPRYQPEPRQRQGGAA